MTLRSVVKVQRDQAHELLAMADQNFFEPFSDANAPANAQSSLNGIALAVATASTVLTLALGFLLVNAIAYAKPVSISGVMLAGSIIIPFFWDAVAAALSLTGLFWKTKPTPLANKRLRIALIVLLYDEYAEPVIERAVRLLASLDNGAGHTFSLHVLSDSRDEEHRLREASVVSVLQRRHPSMLVTYRNRVENTDYKSGNIREWIRSVGHLHDAMLVLDADSVIARDSVLVMAEELASDQSCALVQSIPRVHAGKNLWQAMQAFASLSIGLNFGKGLALVSGGSANYYGHNAMMRIRAFADCAGLPHLPGVAPFGGVIMSHDFVEAALLRRAGWSVKLVPDVTESFEGTPENLAGFLARDRRWCQGNMQHLALLKMPGLTLISRFHLLQGAMTYLNAPLWLLALALWATVQGVANTSDLMMATLLILVTLATPRIIGMLSFSNLTIQRMPKRLAGVEFIMSCLLAPTLMVQRTKMIVSIFLGKSAVWTKRQTCKLSAIGLVKYHVTEVILGCLLSLVIYGDNTKLWIMPVALALLFAPVLAAIVSSSFLANQWRPVDDHG
jgi:membrane glycosyltransferase